MHWPFAVIVAGCFFSSQVLAAPQNVSDIQNVGEQTAIREESLLGETEVTNPTNEEATESAIGTNSLNSTLETSFLKEESEPSKYEIEKPPSVEVTTKLSTEVIESSSVSTTKKPRRKKTTVKPPSEATTKGSEVVAETAIVSTTKKPRRKTTVKPLAAESPVTVAQEVIPSTTTNPTRRYPCKCGGGLCSCCTGMILESFNVPFRSRACANVTYEPDDFTFDFKLSYNDRVLYKQRMSAKNPRPVCIPLNRYFGVKMCVKLSNIYMSGRNVHACLDMEGTWDDEPAFNYSFNCFRIGSQGVAIVRPEDGGGLPPPPDEEEQTDEDYDDSARQWRSDVEIVPN